MFGYTTITCAFFLVSLQSVAGLDVVTFGPTAGNIIRVGSPLSLNRTRWKVTPAVPQLLNTAQMFTYWLNRAHGGVRINGSRYLLSITLVDDKGTQGGVTEATRYLVEQLQVNILLGPARSVLTEPAAAVANSSGALMVAGNAAAKSVFRGRRKVFGVLTPAASWPKPALRTMACKGMKSIGYICQNSTFPKAMCSAIPQLAEDLGVTMVKSILVPTSWTSSIIHDAVLEMKAAAPDVIQLCAHEVATDPLLQSMLNNSFTPSMIVVGGMLPPKFEEHFRFVTHLATWVRDAPLMSAWADNMTASEFAQNYLDQYGASPDWRAAAAWAALEVLVNAIEKANSPIVDEIAAALRTIDMQTLYGRVKFDINNQNINEHRLLQFQAGDDRRPTDVTNQGNRLIYPMPPWEQHVCYRSDSILNAHGFSADGICMECPEIARFNVTARYCYPCAMDEEIATYYSQTLEGTHPVKQCIKRCQAGWAPTRLSNGSTTCFPCRKGHVAVQSTCVGCNVGRYTDQEAQTRCTDCLPGTFGNAAGLSTCHDCAVGKISTGTAATICSLCGQGTYIAAAASSQCQACAPGKFSAVEGATACQLCPLTTTTLFEGAATADSCTCKAESYYDVSDGSCKSCPWLHTTAVSKDACTVRIVEIVALAGGVTASMVLMLGFWYYRKQQQRRIHLLERERWQQIMDHAIKSTTTLDHPMVLIRADSFLNLGKLKSLETLRDLHELIFLDSLAEIAEFKRSNFIIFFSHQWLGWGKPDPENTHYNAMSAAILDLVKCDDIYDDRVKAEIDKWYVWCDFLSISQMVREVQILAINALYLYTCVASVFVIIAPTALHQSNGKICDITTYMSRGWCRLELIGKLCRSGTQHMFMFDGSSKSLKPVTEEDLDRFDLCVCQGEFSCCYFKHANEKRCDKEKLVKSMLGLYSVLLEQRGSPHIDAVLRRIEARKAEFFPQSLVFAKNDENGKTCQTERKLFGPLIDMVEKKEEEQMAMMASPSMNHLLRMDSRIMGSSSTVCSLCSQGEPTEFCKVCGVYTL